MGFKKDELIAKALEALQNNPAALEAFGTAQKAQEIQDKVQQAKEDGTIDALTETAKAAAAAKLAEFKKRFGF